MRNLQRNTVPVYFKKFTGNREILDEWGNPTGSFTPEYGALELTQLCVSPNRGSAEEDAFGSLADYDRVMSTSDPNCPINENSILWLDGADTGEEHNYVVLRVAPWKNSTTYAVKRVTIRE